MGGDDVEIKLVGVETSETAGKGSTSFFWNTQSQDGQYVSNGVYLVRVEELDAYGSPTIKTISLTVLNVDEYVELSIFNSAGELVKNVKEPLSSLPSDVSLGTQSTVNVGSGSDVVFKYGPDPADYIAWDGKNFAGQTVTNGTYEITLAIKTREGLAYNLSKTVTVLNEGSALVSGFKVYPNPYSAEFGGVMKYAWVATQSGTARLSIYNVKGEKVRTLYARLESGSADWDLLTTSGDRAAGGYYVTMLEAVSGSGQMQRLKVKSAVILRSSTGAE